MFPYKCRMSKETVLPLMQNNNFRTVSNNIPSSVLLGLRRTFEILEGLSMLINNSAIIIMQSKVISHQFTNECLIISHKLCRTELFS